MKVDFDINSTKYERIDLLLKYIEKQVVRLKGLENDFAMMAIKEGGSERASQYKELKSSIVKYEKLLHRMNESVNKVRNDIVNAPDLSMEKLSTLNRLMSAIEKQNAKQIQSLNASNTKFKNNYLAPKIAFNHREQPSFEEKSLTISINNRLHQTNAAFIELRELTILMVNDFNNDRLVVIKNQRQKMMEPVFQPADPALIREQMAAFRAELGISDGPKLSENYSKRTYVHAGIDKAVLS